MIWAGEFVEGLPDAPQAFFEKAGFASNSDSNAIRRPEELAWCDYGFVALPQEGAELLDWIFDSRKQDGSRFWRIAFERRC